jgi:hypothetical protein
MKISHNRIIFGLLVPLLGAWSCVRPPDLPETPSISFENVEFEILNQGDPLFEETVLRLSLNIADGNGDLGLDGSENFEPYQPFNLVVENDQYIEFGDRPGDPPFSCLDYAIEDGENTDLNNDGDLLDTLLIDFNQNQFNIEVDFYVKERGQFREIELRAQPPGSPNENTFCGISFDGRFPCLSSDDNPCNFVQSNSRPIEGVITYDMNSGLFLPIFRTDTMKLQFKIRDRALNESNTAETPEFTLQSITISSNDDSGDDG